MKSLLQRSVLGGLTLALVLGIGLHLRETRVQAQATTGAAQTSAAEAQSPEKTEPRAVGDCIHGDEFRAACGRDRMGSDEDWPAIYAD